MKEDMATDVRSAVGDWKMQCQLLVAGRRRSAAAIEGAVEGVVAGARTVGD